jgi:hypothetical protein
MRELILIAGLPGSGKSFLGRELSQETGYPFLDDVSRTLDPDRQPVIQLSQYSQHEGLILADPWLCAKDGITNARLLLSKAFPGVSVRLICFENDLAVCLQNVKQRADGREVLGLLKTLAAVWNPKEIKDCELRSVYSLPCKA